MLACVGVIGIAGLYGLRNSLRGDFGGQDKPTAWDGDFAQIPRPANNATGAERVEQWRKAGYSACVSQSVMALARQLETMPAAEAVARGYGRYARTLGNPPSNAKAAYEGCLQGFRGQS